MLTKEKRKALLQLSTPFVADAMWRLGIETSVDPAIGPTVPFSKMVGTAVTLSLRSIEPRSEMVPLPHYQEAFKAGSEVYAPIMAIEVPKDRHRWGIWGEGATTQAKRHGFVGALVDGAVRDTWEMRDMRFPVFSRAVASGFIIGKVESVSFNEPVTVGDVLVRPGDVVFADNDGVVIIPEERLEAVIGRAQAIHRWEEAVHGLVRRGLEPEKAMEQIGPMP